MNDRDCRAMIRIHVNSVISGTRLLPFYTGLLVRAVMKNTLSS